MTNLPTLCTFFFGATIGALLPWTFGFAPLIFPAVFLNCAVLCAAAIWLRQ